MAENILYGGFNYRWCIPVWTEAQKLPSLSASDQVISLDPTDRDFRVGDFVYFWRSPELWAIGVVGGIAAQSITLVDLLGTNFDYAWVMPMRYGRLKGQPGRNTDGFQSIVSLSLEADDNQNISTTAPTQYLNHDLYLDEFLLPGSSSDFKINNQVVIEDYGVGVVQNHKQWIHSRILRPAGFVNSTLAETAAFRKWLFRRQGRYSPFWMPSFENDLRIDTLNTITDKVQIRRDSYDDLGYQRQHVAFKTLSGDWYCRAVISVSVLPGGERLELTLDSALPSLDPSAISRLCFLSLHRLNSDRIQLNWQAGVSQCAVSFLEIEP